MNRSRSLLQNVTKSKCYKRLSIKSRDSTQKAKHTELPFNRTRKQLFQVLIIEYDAKLITGGDVGGDVGGKVYICSRL